MIWIGLSIVSSLLLGLYDVAQKAVVERRSVVATFWLSTLVCSLLFLPAILLSCFAPQWVEGRFFYLAPLEVSDHLLIALKSAILFVGFNALMFATRHLPITITSPIKATHPVLVLLGAVWIYGERLNGFQWAGVATTVLSFYLLSLSGRREGVNFRRNRWILLMVLHVLMGATSGLYDKFLLARYSVAQVVVWHTIYLFLFNTALIVPMVKRGVVTLIPVRQSGGVVLIAVLLLLSDVAYFYALTFDDALLSVASMIRRGSIVVAFVVGALLFKERNLKRKMFDLILVIVGLMLLLIGSY